MDLKRLNRELKTKIYQSISPYIGYQKDLLNDQERSFIAAVIKRSAGNYGALAKGLNKFPAIFLCYITHELKIYLRDASSIYSGFNRLLELPISYTPSSQEKEQLWRAFRQACYLLGLPVSNRTFGANFMVDTYYEQIGLLSSVKKNLFKSMEKQVKLVGLPDKEDVIELNDWYNFFKTNYCSSFNERIKRIIENDKLAYYPQLFIVNLKIKQEMQRLAMTQTIEASDFTANTAVKIPILPTLTFDGSYLTLNIYATEDVETWYVAQDGVTEEFTITETQEDIILDSFETQNYAITPPGSSSAIINFQLWQHDQRNQLAFFDMETERFVSSHCILDDGTSLEPGNYWVLSRFPIEEDWLHTSNSDLEDFYVGELNLKAGDCYLLKRGRICFAINAHSLATVQLLGHSVSPYEGRKFLISNELKVAVIIPTAWSEYSYTLEVKIADLNESIQLDVKESGEFEISELIKDWPAGMRRTQLILRHEKQTIARSTALLWVGFTKLKYNYLPEVSSWPENIDKDNCHNIYLNRDENCFIVKDNGLQFIRISFNLNKQQLSFKFALPGTYIYLINPNEIGNKPKLIRSGTNITASHDDIRLIKIYSTNKGQLSIGSNIIDHDFSKKPWAKFSIPALYSYADNENTQLTLQTASSNVPLVNLTSLHYVSHWLQHVKGNRIEFSFKTPAEIHQLTITATNLFTQVKQRLTLEQADNVIISSNSQISGQLIINTVHDELLNVVPLQIENLDKGNWLLEFDCKIGNRWGKLISEREQQFIFVIRENSELISDLTIEQKNRSLDFITRVLGNPYHDECWQTINWLKDLWCDLLADHEVLFANNIKRILPLMSEMPVYPNESCWIPPFHIGAYQLTIFATKANEFNRIDVGQQLNLRCYKAMYESSKDLYSAIATEILSDELVTAFANVAAIIKIKEQPQQLSLSTIVDVYGATTGDRTWAMIALKDKKPAIGDLLGGFHLLYAQRECLLYFRNCQTDNDLLLPTLCRIAAINAAAEDESLPLLIPTDYFENEEEARLLVAINQLAASFAKRCRQPVDSQMKLVDFWQAYLKYMPNKTTQLTDVISLFLHNANQLFHYYLLLWEVYYISWSNK